MARTFVEAFRKLDKDVRIKEAPTAKFGVMRIEEHCRLRARLDSRAEKVQRSRAWVMFGFQLAYYQHQETLRRGEMRLKMTEQDERAGKAVPEMSPFEIA
jgi:hypothetical protein